MYFNQQQHTNLVDELQSWWLSNGWNIVTLRRKTINELLAIRERMRRSGYKPFSYCPPAMPKYRQVSLW